MRSRIIGDHSQKQSRGPVVHDPNGNLTSAPGKVGAALVNQGYSFNVRNQLTAVPTSAATYQYNAEGHLKLRTVAGVATSYLINPVAELPQILSATTSGHTTRYIYGLGLLYEERPDGSIRSYHFDHRGNTVALAAGDGVTVLARADYTPYGSLSNSSGALETPFLYNGRYGVLTDPATGLIHMRARWYSPYLKRFINADPAGFAGGMNFYAFAAGNPISFADPSGLGPRAWGRTFGGNSIVQTILSPVTASIQFLAEGYYTNSFYPRYGESGGLAMHGILNSRSEGELQIISDRTNRTIIDNRSAGGISDVIQTALGRVPVINLFDSLAHRIGREVRDNPTIGRSIFLHSQATVHGTNATFFGYIPQSSDVHLASPALFRGTSGLASSLSWVNIYYNQPLRDVAHLYSSLNPVAIFGVISNPVQAINIHNLNGTIPHAP